MSSDVTSTSSRQPASSQSCDKNAPSGIEPFTRRGAAIGSAKVVPRHMTLACLRCAALVRRLPGVGGKGAIRLSRISSTASQPSGWTTNRGSAALHTPAMAASRPRGIPSVDAASSGEARTTRGTRAPSQAMYGEGRAKKPSVRISTHPTARGCDSSHRAVEPVARVTPVTTIPKRYLSPTVIRDVAGCRAGKLSAVGSDFQERNSRARARLSSLRARSKDSSKRNRGHQQTNC